MQKKKKQKSNKRMSDGQSVSANSKGLVAAKSGDGADDTLGLQSISIRLQKDLLEDLKRLAKDEGLGYQPFVRQILTRYVKERKRTESTTPSTSDILSNLAVRTAGDDEDSISPVHPGEILSTEFMKPLGLSVDELGLHTGLPVARISEIVRGLHGITADTALKLGKYFRTSAQFWLNLQSRYELEMENYQL